MDCCHQDPVRVPLKPSMLGQYHSLPQNPHWVAGRPAAPRVGAVVADQVLEVADVAEVEAQGYFAAAKVVSRGGEGFRLPDLEPVQGLVQEELLARTRERPTALEQERVATLQSSAHWQTPCSPPCHLC